MLGLTFQRQAVEVFVRSIAHQVRDGLLVGAYRCYVSFVRLAFGMRGFVLSFFERDPSPNSRCAWLYLLPSQLDWDANGCLVPAVG